MATLKAKIYVTQRDNDKYFNQRLPTFRKGFCEITRNVSLELDPNGIWQPGEYGFITTNNRKIIVTRGSVESSFEILS